MKQYENYIFDLYGTLIDIHTDESVLSLWKAMSGFYRAYGVSYAPRELEKAYLRLVHEEEEALRKKLGSPYAEIDLERVFVRLYEEGEDCHSEACPRNPIRVADFSPHVAANVFRAASRTCCKLYKNTKKTLKELRARGSKLFLLSNAQATFTMTEIEDLGLDKLLDVIYISSDAGYKKPAPEFMKLLLKEQHLDPKTCVMVGNEFEADMGSAKAGGMDGILLNTFPYSNEELKAKNKAGYPVITDIGELL